MARTGLVFAGILALAGLLAGCSEGDPKDTPYAPGVSRAGQSVDGVLVGHRLMQAGEYELAINAFTRAAVDQGTTAEILAGLGSAHLGMGRLGQAEQLLRSSIDKEEDAPETWNNLGVVLMEKGETAEASEVFRRAYAMDDGQSDSIRDNLRLALAKLDNPVYAGTAEQDYKLVRRGSSDYLIRQIP